MSEHEITVTVKETDGMHMRFAIASGSFERDGYEHDLKVDVEGASGSPIVTIDKQAYLVDMNDLIMEIVKIHNKEIEESE